MRNFKNPFCNLALRLQVPGSDQAHLRGLYSSKRIAEAGDERIDFLSQKLTNGKWAYGYLIYFADGRHASKLPVDNELGLFKSENDALLFFLGYCKEYRVWFSTEIVKQIDKAIAANMKLPGLS